MSFIKKPSLPVRKSSVPVERPFSVERSLKRLLSLPVMVQRTQPWYDAREKVITASEYASCFKLTASVIRPYVEYFGYADFPARPKKTAAKESAQKLILKKTGQAAPFTGNRFTEFGTLYEPVASTVYQQMTGTKLHEFGLILHPTVHFLGASPDGCTEHGVLVEIKCPSSRVPDGTVPFEYWCQMQLQLECCDLEVCDFLDARFVEYLDEEAWREGALKHEASGARHHAYGFILMSETGLPKHAGPTVRTLADFENWERQVVGETGEPHTRVLYSLWAHHLVRVRRERRWMSERIPEIERVWNEIVKVRRAKDEAKAATDVTGPAATLEVNEEPAEVDWKEKKRNKSDLRCDHCLV